MFLDSMQITCFNGGIDRCQPVLFDDAEISSLLRTRGFRYMPREPSGMRILHIFLTRAHQLINKQKVKPR